MGHAAQYETDVLDKAQIEHTICFIQDRHLDVPQVKYMLLEVVDDAAGRADQYIHALLENSPLLLVIDAAEHNRHLKARVLAYA